MLDFNVVMAFLLLPAVHACTVVMVGKDASADGTTMVGHVTDAGGGAADLRFARVPAMDHPKGAKRPVYHVMGGYPRIISTERGPTYQPVGDQKAMKPLGYIDQVEHTYAYFENDYGLVNEHGLAMGESTVSANTIGFPSDQPGGYCWWGIAELSRVALERCKTARCAIQLMGDLAVEHGFWSEDSGSWDKPDRSDSAESLGVCDGNECFVFNIATGLNYSSAVWAAQRLGDDQVTTIPNTITIHVIDFDDDHTFLTSPNIREVAKEGGFWDGKGDFDFCKAFSYDEVVERVETIMSFYSGRRMWRVFDLVAPSLKLSPYLGYATNVITYPFSVKPDMPVDRRFLMRIYRDYYQGTAFDMSKGWGAGPFNSPVRFDTPDWGLNGSWERPISIFRGIFSTIIQTKGDAFAQSPAETKAVVWYGQDAPIDTLYIPFYASQDTVPASYQSVKNSVFSYDAAWWAFDFVGNFMQLKWSYMLQDVQARQQTWEDRAENMLNELEKKAGSAPQGTNIKALLADHTNAHANSAIDDWWALGRELIAKYSDGYICTGEAPAQQLDPGYPAWWLNHTEYVDFPINGKLPLEDRHGYHPWIPPPIPKPAGATQAGTSMELAAAATACDQTASNSSVWAFWNVLVLATGVFLGTQWQKRTQRSAYSELK